MSILFAVMKDVQAGFNFSVLSRVIKLRWQPNSHADNQLSVLPPERLSLKSSRSLCEVASIICKIKKSTNKTPIFGSRLSRSQSRLLSLCLWRNLRQKPTWGGAPPSPITFILLFYWSPQTPTSAWFYRNCFFLVYCCCWFQARPDRPGGFRCWCLVLHQD